MPGGGLVRSNRPSSSPTPSRARGLWGKGFKGFQVLHLQGRGGVGLAALPAGGVGRASQGAAGFVVAVATATHAKRLPFLPLLPNASWSRVDHQSPITPQTLTPRTHGTHPLRVSRQQLQHLTAGLVSTLWRCRASGRRRTRPAPHRRTPRARRRQGPSGTTAAARSARKPDPPRTAAPHLRALATAPHACRR